MNDNLKHMYLFMISLIPLYIGLFVILFFETYVDQPYVSIAAIFVLAIPEAFGLRNFMRKTAFAEKPQNLPRTVRPIDADSGTEERKVTIHMSRYMKSKYRLAVDGTEIAVAEGGDRLKTSLPARSCTLNVGYADAPAGERMPTGITLPAGGDLDIYVSMDRSKGFLKIDNVTGKVDEAAARDEASVKKLRMIFDISSMCMPFIFAAVIAVFAFFVA